VGEITSGSFSPTLQKSIAMAYVPESSAPGTELLVDIRGRREPARVVPLPFTRDRRINDTCRVTTIWRESHRERRTLLYSESHEWVRVAEEDGAKIATVGISAFAVEQLTDLVYMELPEVGRQVSGRRGVRRGRVGQGGQPALQPGRWRGRRGQRELPDRLETLGEDPYEAGWIIKVKLTDESSWRV
jgi:glycine cleavage system H protein